MGYDSSGGFVNGRLRLPPQQNPNTGWTIDQGSGKLVLKSSQMAQQGQANTGHGWEQQAAYGLSQQEQDAIRKNQTQLQMSELAQFQKAALQRKQIQDEAAASQQKLLNYQKLATSGVAGAKQVQQFLNQNGQKVAVDGNIGDETSHAFDAYSKQLSDHYNNALTMTNTAMDLNFIRNSTNRSLEQKANGPNGARLTASSQLGGIIRGLDQNVALLLSGVNQGDKKAVGKVQGHLQDYLPPVAADQTGSYAMGYVAQLRDSGKIDQKAYDTIKALSDRRSQYFELANKVMDPTKVDNLGAVKLQNRIIASQVQGLMHDNMVDAHKDPLDAWNLTKEILGNDFKKLVAPVLKEVNDDFISRPIAAYSAAMRARIKGGNFFEAVGAGIDSLTKIQALGHTLDAPFVGQVDALDKTISQSATETMMQDQRAKLTAQGDLVSLGQWLTGRVPHQFAVKHPDMRFGIGEHLGFLNPVAKHAGLQFGKDSGAAPVDIGTAKHDFLSGLIDIATLPAKDPTFFLGGALHEGAAFTELAAERALSTASEDGIRAAGVAFLHEQAANEGVDALKRFATSTLTDQEIAQAGRTAIQQMGRRYVMDMSVNGRLMSGAVTEAMARANSGAELARMLPGLQTDVANRAYAAKTAFDGVTDAANMAGESVIHDAIAAGEFAPKIGVTRRFLNVASEKLPGLEGSVGRKAFRAGSLIGDLTGDRLGWLRHMGAPRGMSASVFETSAGNQMGGALEQAAKVGGGRTVNGLFHELVAPGLEGVSLHDRFWTVGQYLIDHPDDQLFKAAYDGLMRPYFDNPETALFMREAMLSGTDPATVLEHIFAHDGFEQNLRAIETAIAVTEGHAGADAAKKFAIEMAAMRTGGTREAEGLVRDASRLTGVGLGKIPQGATAKGIQDAIEHLPEGALQEHFKQLLEGLGSNASENAYGKLLRDIQAVAGKSGLRKQVEKQLGEIAARLGQSAEGAPAIEGNALQRGVKVGIGKVARGVLGASEVDAPNRLSLAGYGSANPFYNARVRGTMMDRIAGAFNLPPEVRATLVESAQNAQTEKDIFDAVDRALRANLSARGFSGVDAEYIMDVLKDRGTFRINVAESPIFTVDPISGEKVTDPQLLAQHVESVSVPSDNSVASAVRQAILDGAVDGDTGQRLAARLRVIVEAPNRIKLVSSTGKAVVRTASWFHNMWKFLVVTNALHPIIGGALGFLMTPGGLNNKLMGAGLGFGLGVANMARAAFRISVLESRNRIFLADTSLPDFSIDGWARGNTRRYGADPFRRVQSGDAVKIGDTAADAWFGNDILVHTDPGWEIIDKTHSRAADAWWRIHSFQIHPESDPVMAIVLREDAGQLGGERKVISLVQANPEGDAAAAEPNLFAEAMGGGEDTQQIPVDELTPGNKLRYDVGPLAEDVKANGIQEPLVVRRNAEGALEVVEGNHRLEAAKLAGLSDVPAKYEAAPNQLGALENMLGGGEQAGAQEAEQQFKRVVKTITETPREAADKAFNEFLNTEEGKVWKQRWQRLGVKPKDAIERYRTFVERYSTPELSAQRVGGGVNDIPQQVDRSVFERMVKDGEGPDSFHVQQTWKMPRSFADIYRSYKKIALKGVLSGPDNALNRRPWQNKLFDNEYDRLVRNGIAPERAQMLADEFATVRVNDVLHRYDEPTRLSKKLDPFMPFQHARMDLFRVYGKLAVENPFKVFQVSRYVAKAFNGGVESGIFTKNETTGEWQLTIPGSGRLSQALFGTVSELPFSLNIRDAFFITSGAYGISIVPQPGGPFWSMFSRELANHAPELFSDLPHSVDKWLFPYGPSGRLLKGDTSRMWMAMTGHTPPWEFENAPEQQNQLNHWKDEIAKEMVYQHRLKGDQNYLPSDEDVNKALEHFMKAWSFFQSFPGSTYPVLTTKNKYESAVNDFTLGGLLDFGDPEVRQSFLNKYPEFEPYTYGDQRYVGPDDLNTLKRLGVGTPYNNYSKWNPETNMWESLSTPDTESQNAGYQLSKQLGDRQYLDWRHFKQVIIDARRTNDYFTKLRNAEAVKEPFAREQAISQVKKDYADVAGKYRREQDILGDLVKVLGQYPKGQTQADALTRIKSQYGLSNADLIRFTNKARAADGGKVIRNRAWADARSGDELNTSVENAGGYGVGADWKKAAYVATLAPAEQLNYWQFKMDTAGTDGQLDTSKSVMDKYFYYEKQYFTAKDQYFSLFAPKEVDPAYKQWQDRMSVVKQSQKDQLTAAFTQIDTLKNEIDAAYKAKNYKAVDALRAQKADAESLVSVIRDSLYKQYPDLTTYYADLHAATVYDNVGGFVNRSRAAEMRQQAELDRANAPLWHAGEEARFLHMPAAVQAAYMQQMVDHLDMPGDKTMPKEVSAFLKDNYGAQKLYWEWLTSFQQELLQKNYPSYAEKWQYESDHDLHGPGNTSKHKLQANELDVTMSLLRQYELRKGDAPAAYNQFVNLPKNAAVKREFLDKHPEVAQWIQSGPLSNMPTLYRELAMGTLVKYSDPGYSTGHGRSFGRSRFNPNAFAQSGDFHGVKFGQLPINLQWAIEQMKVWSQRPTKNAPANYDVWVNMPTGSDKAAYLQAHPEVQDWIREGPMANMPDEYKQVVRDIMIRYHEWTAKQDPLGQTISQYFATPGYARDQFMLNHPELEVYFATTRSPQDQIMFGLQNQYFQIQDVAAKRAFLEAHPELQQHFVDARTKRYERFLNQVAVYMGANPDMFKGYLDRQTDILSELLRKFAEPGVIREASPATVLEGQTHEGGRTRHSRSAA